MSGPKDLKLFSRSRWAEASKFHPHSAVELLQVLVQKIEHAGEVAVVLFDLDSTLFDVGPRHWRILQEWSQEWSEATSKTDRSGIAIALASARPAQLGYSVEDTLCHLGIDLSHAEARSAMADLKRFWARRFFTHDYLVHDKVTPGAREFVARVAKAGASILYLTGRDEPGMGEGTRRILNQHGFPLDGVRSQLWLKPRFEMDDATFKRETVNRIRELGELVASFENEPRNLVMLRTEFPDALHVWLETVASDHPAPPVRGIYRLKDFRA